MVDSIGNYYIRVMFFKLSTIHKYLYNIKTMTTIEKIREEVKKAMVARDSLRLNTLRGLLSAFTNELVAKKRRPTEELPDEEAIEVIKRAVKQRKDSIEQFSKGGRGDLVENEEAELKILSEFMPKMMPREEILKIAEAKKNEMGITDKSKAGILMGAVMRELKGSADGGEVKDVIDSLF